MAFFKRKYEILQSETGNRRVLLVQNKWSTKYENLLRKNKIDCLRISMPGAGAYSNLDFLKDLEDLNLYSVEIYINDIKDLTGLKYVTGVKELSLFCPVAKPISLDIFPNLEDLGLRLPFKTQDQIHLPSSLKKLVFECAPVVDLSFLSPCSKLEILDIDSRKLVDISQLELLQDLRHLSIFRSNKLTDFSAIGLCKKLDFLEIHSNKQVYDLQFLEGLVCLKSLLLMSCGKLKSAHPIAMLKKLEILGLPDSIFDDKDISALETLPELKTLVAKSHRQYKPNVDEIIKSLQ